MALKIFVIHYMFAALGAVFMRPVYVIFAAGATFVLLFAAAWMRNVSFLWFLLSSPQFSTTTKFKVFEWTFVNLLLNTSPARFALIITAALLAGVNLALLVFYLRKRLAVGRELGASAGGLIISGLGIGCASCGSVLLSSVLGLSASAATLAALPLQGTEFTLAGIGLIAVSIVMLAKKINDPLVCGVKEK